MQEVSVVFPHQLFQQNPCLHLSRPVYLIEEWLFFRQYSFHKQKLTFHRASMKGYQHHLTAKGFSVHYIEAFEEGADIRCLLPLLAAKGVTAVHHTEVVDDWLEGRLQKGKKYGIQLWSYKTPAFLNTMKEANSFFNGRKYFQTDFYIWQRKKRGLLADGNKPVGGKWSYDAENRKKLPKREMVPPVSLPLHNRFVPEAQAYVQKHFPGNIGNTGSPFTLNEASFYPVTYEEAEDWLQQFFVYRFARFGMYEDAMVGDRHVLYHSVLSPLLNTGLLTPQHVIDTALEAAAAYAVPLNSLEGFIRQIVGWREYIRILYEREGRAQRTGNFWNHTRSLPPSFYTGTTGIPPVDTVIKKVLRSGWCHHIERLMVMGNFMMLCGFHPDGVYRWFTEMYIDAYDWVMVPNTYGMTQAADGGTMMTKPYISSSHYLLKMGDWKPGPWQDIWDALFWRFLHLHRPFFAASGRLGYLLQTLDKLPPEKLRTHLHTADVFLQGLAGE